MHFDLDAIGAGLPVAAALGELDAALISGAVVVQAPPGTGKTTLVPVAVANRVAGRVVVTQPRRVAARAAARRVASLAGVKVGDEVGYVVRGDSAVSTRTRVEFCTAGVLLRRLLAEPELDGIDAVILDEVHERALETDLAFAMLAELRQLRPELVVVVMSATLDAERWAGLLSSGDPTDGGVAVVRVAAETHPLEVRWAPAAGLRTDARGVTPSFVDHLADQASRLVDEQLGDVLVFAPGARECDQVVSRLRARGIEADALHGSLSPRDQDRVLSRPLPGESPGTLTIGAAAHVGKCAAAPMVSGAMGRPRVIVATSIAESSLTVPGVRAVVDSGLAREPRYDSGRGMAGLVTVSEARSSAEQRAGRAARLGPGIVVRCWPQDDWAGMRPFTAPEITTTDLTQAVLDLACWGAPGGIGLALPDPLPAAAFSLATDALRGLGAIDDAGHATDFGRRLSRLPVDPRLGRALLDCAPRLGAHRVAEVVAMLSGDQRAIGGDLAGLLRTLRGQHPASWTREVQRLTRLADESSSRRPRQGHPDPTAQGSTRPSGGRGDAGSSTEPIAEVVAAAWPERIARARSAGSLDYLTAGGTGLELPRDSALKGEPWLAVAEMGRAGDRAIVRAAVPMDEATARRAGAGLLVERIDAQWSGGRVTARRVTALGAIELTSTPVAPTAEVGTVAVRAALAERGLREVLDWGEGVERLRRRLALLHQVMGEPWPAVDDGSLLERADEWLGTELRALAGGTPASRLDLVSALRRLVPWPAAGRLEELVPERIEVPTGSMIRLDYPEDPHDRVVLAVKLQECFGLVDTPRICDGRLPVLMHLLSPAQRPLAVTDDLASFWVNAYPGVRAENRGRYIKHPWPEDPLTAPPRRGTTRSGR